MSQLQVYKDTQSGFTLLEMLITLIVLAVLVSLAMPGMSEFSIKQKFIGAAEQVYGHIQQARSEAIASSAITYVKFAPTAGTTTWRYGISTAPTVAAATPGCDLTVTSPTTADACVIVVDDGDGTVDGINGAVDTGDRILMRFSDADYTGNQSIEMTLTDGTHFIFDPVRGTLSSGAGGVNLESTTGLQLRVEVSALGRVSICSPDGSVPNYGTC